MHKFEKLLKEVVKELKKLGVKMRPITKECGILGTWGALDSLYKSNHVIRLSVWGPLHDLYLEINIRFGALSEFGRLLEEKVKEKYGFPHMIIESKITDVKPAILARDIVDAIQCYEKTREEIKKAESEIRAIIESI